MHAIRKLGNNIMVFVSILLGLTLIFSYLSVYVNPQSFWLFSIVGLGYPVLLLLNVLLLVYWILRWKWDVFIPLVAILLGINHFSSFFQFPFGKVNTAGKGDVKVLTYNVNLFKLYYWSNEEPTHKKVFEFIRNENIDIVCLQEFYVVNGKLSEKQAREKIGYNAHIGYIVKRKESGYGLATFSKYPIVNTGEIKFENSANACIFTDVLINGDTVRVYNNHLQSVRLKERNISFLINQNYRKDSQKMDEIKDISFRYRDALVKRAKQVELVTEHILKSPYPAIVCGDFNESPISYNYRQMRKNLDDSFVEMGSGVGYTYRGFIPSFRIDFILYNPKFKSTSYRSPKVNYSDHYPVISTINVK